MADNQKLAKTIFKTGAKDDVLVKDAYKVNNDVPSNKIVSTIESLTKNALGGKLAALGKAQGLLAKAKNGLGSVKAKVAAVRDKVKAVANSPAIAKIKSGLNAVKENVNKIRGQVVKAAGAIRKVRDNVASVKNSINSFKQTGKQFVGGFKDMGKDLKNAKQNFLAEAKGTVSGRLDGMLDTKKLGLGNLTDNVKRDFERNVGLVKETASITTLGLDGKATTTKKATNTIEAQSTAASINAYTGKADGVVVIDIEAERALAEAFAKDALNSGMAGAFPDIIEQVKDGKSLNAVLVDSFAVAANNSQIDTVAFILTKTTGPQIRAGFPDAVNRVLKNYVIPEDKGANSWPELSAQLIETLDKLDEQWWFKYRGTDIITNLGPFQVATEDASRLLALDERLESSVAIGKDFDPRSFEQSVKDYYPFVTVLPRK